MALDAGCLLHEAHTWPGPSHPEERAYDSPTTQMASAHGSTSCSYTGARPSVQVGPALQSLLWSPSVD